MKVAQVHIDCLKANIDIVCQKTLTPDRYANLHPLASPDDIRQSYFKAVQTIDEDIFLIINALYTNKQIDNILKDIIKI